MIFDKEKYSKAIRLIMKNRGMSLERVAQIMEICSSTLINALDENHGSNPSTNTRDAIKSFIERYKDERISTKQSGR